LPHVTVLAVKATKMGKMQEESRIEALTEFTDIAFLSDKQAIPTEVKRLFKRKKLSFCLLPVEGYHLIHAKPNLVGTVVIDVEGMDVASDKTLARVLETLERNNLGTILLTQKVQRVVRSFSLAPTESSFSVSANGVESVTLDALWARISVNLADRKSQNVGIAVKPPISPSPIEKTIASASHPTDQPQSPASATIMGNLTEQLRLAGLVQRDFLPAQLPNCSEAQWAASFIPAEWVSGDIYDVARVDEQHIGFYIADAVGHSMPAALLTIFIKQALAMRETVNNSYRIFAPREVVKNLNLKMISQKLSGYQFVTCCYCLLNVRTRQMAFARGGHPYPILLRDGQDPKQLEVRGSLLGVFDNAEFEQQVVQLESGDKILLYSDGAESVIGSLDDQTTFQFSQDFLDLKDGSITELIDGLTELSRTKTLEPSEVDDFTLVGLQVP
jgi:sigma-B regulation protein RsbU (phosphoserine phosphatase)